MITIEETPKAPGTEQGAAPQGQETSEPTTPQVSPSGSVQEPQSGDEEAVFELDVANLERDAEGNFVLKIDPDDPSSTVYKGKTPAEIFEAMQKGLREKDEYIRSLKTEKVIKVPEKYRRNGSEQPTTEEEPVKIPTESEIFHKHLADAVRRHSVDAVRLQWDDEKWKQYARENDLDAWQVFEERQKVKQAIAEANTATDQELRSLTILRENQEIMDEETDQVRDLLVEAKIDAAAFEKVYEQILDRAWKNRRENGRLRSGFIVKEAIKEINRIRREQGKSALRQEVEEEIARGKEKKERIKTFPATSGSPQPHSQVPADYEDATTRAFAEYRAGRR